MRTRSLFIIFNLVFFLLKSQNIVWLDTLKYSVKNLNNGVAMDKNGNVYCAGAFSGYNSTGYNGIYIEKRTPYGNLLWIDSAHSNQSAASSGVVVDSAGNAYTAVWVGGTYLKFGNTSYTGGSTMYLIKYNSSGQRQWVVNQGNYSSPNYMAIDRHGYVYVTGAWAGGGGFVTKYDGSGNLLLTLPVGGWGLGLDYQNNIYVVNGSLVEKHYPNGALQWSYPTTLGSKIAIDSTGNCYITEQGSYGASTLTKISAAAQTIWSFTVPYWGGNGIYCDNLGSIYVSGVYGSGNTAYGVVIEKYGNNGSLIWNYQWANPVIGIGDLIANNSTLYIAAGHPLYYYAYLLKLNEPLATLAKEIKKEDLLRISPNPTKDVFLVSYINTNFNGPLNLKVSDSSGKYIYTKTYKDYPGELNETIDLSGFAKGAYIIEIIGAGCKETKKLILQ